MPPHFLGSGMSSSKKKETNTSQPPLPPRWKGQDSLELVYQLNERALTLLSQFVKQGSGLWPGAPESRSVWASVSEQGLQRAARFPFVIVDASFMDEAWWRSVAADPSRVIAGPTETLVWPPEASEDLLGELLVFAWHTVKWDRRIARLSLGVISGVADVIATLTPRQLAIVSARHATILRLRWQEDPEFWTRLIKAAGDGDEEALSDIQLHAKLLLSGPLVAGRDP